MDSGVGLNTTVAQLQRGFQSRWSLQENQDFMVMHSILALENRVPGRENHLVPLAWPSETSLFRGQKHENCVVRDNSPNDQGVKRKSAERTADIRL